MIRARLAGCALAGLVACGPMPLVQAEQQCEERARLATGPRGTVGIGIGSGGPVGSLDVTVSSEFLRGSDPFEVYDRCVRNLSGQGPTRLPDLQ